MFKKKVVLCFLTGISYTIASSQNIDLASPLTLQRCIDIAINNNPEVKQSAYQVELDQVQWRQQKATILPTFLANVSESYYYGRSINIFTNSYTDKKYNGSAYQLSSGVTLWNGFSLQHFIRQYKLSYEAAKLDLQQVKDNVTINVILSYLNVVSAKEQLALLQKQVEASQKKVELLETKSKAGALPPTDLLDMKGQLINDEINVIAQKNKLEQSKLTLAQLIGISYAADMDVRMVENNELPTDYGVAIDEVYQKALKTLAIVKAADFRIQSMQYNIKAIKAQALPKLSLSADAYSNYSSLATTFLDQKIPYEKQLKSNFNTNVGAYLQIPILNNFQNRYKLQQANILLKQNTYQAEVLKRQLRQAIEKDYLDLIASYEIYKKSIIQEQNITKSFQIMETKYNAGAITSTEFLISRKNLDKAAIDLVIAKYDYLLRRKVLDFYRAAF